ncbi:hypothetical protein KIPB_000129 [Kipferlia bialata]|uniref:Uncharacterized protein n=1 Tax=Kipferlia bialata TaxID=797122 RepID=A0A9K3GEP8_9EUKA|nr:hypothetical protein KIPB_000129 [Kipferlia bialata]|eukprot:g129.t1
MIASPLGKVLHDIHALVFPPPQAHGPKRLVSMDFARGLAILGMLFAHTTGGSADTHWYLEMDTLAKKLTILLFIPTVIFSGWRGFFIQVSGTVFGYVQVANAVKQLSKGAARYRAYCISLFARYVSSMVILFGLVAVQQWLRGVWYQCIPDNEVFWLYRWYQMGQVESNPLSFFAIAFPLLVLVLALVVPLCLSVIRRVAPKGVSALRTSLVLAGAFYTLSLVIPLFTEPVREWVRRYRGWTRYEYATTRDTSIDTTRMGYYSLLWPHALSGWLVGVFPFFGSILQGVAVGVVLRHCADTRGETAVAATPASGAVPVDGDNVESASPPLESPSSARVLSLLWWSAIPYAVMAVITTVYYGLDMLVTSPDVADQEVPVDLAFNFMSVPQYYLLSSLETLMLTWFIYLFERTDRQTAVNRTRATLWVRRFSTMSLSVFALEFCVDGPVSYPLRFMDENIIGWMNSRDSLAIVLRAVLTLGAWLVLSVCLDTIEYRFTADWFLTRVGCIVAGKDGSDPLSWQHTRCVPIVALETTPIKSSPSASASASLSPLDTPVPVSPVAEEARERRQ